MFEELPLDELSSPVALPRQIPKPLALPPRWEPDVPLPPPPHRIYPFLSAEKQENNSVEYRALVGYLGTIEMPKELQPGSKLQVVRSCIRRLRAEKRAHTLVLMSICTCSLVLTNCHQAPLAEYPAERVTFCGASSDEDRRFFGLVTTAEASSSCHVFAVERRLAGSHADHVAKAEAFKLVCSTDCREFPASSDPIVSAIKTLYARDEPLVANSPQPSHASTTASSNSDSGIGFRDDCGHQSDRILVVDVQNQRLHIQTPQAARVFELRERLTVRAMPDPDLVRLSPKVFPRPSASCSLEDLKTHHELDSSPPPPPPLPSHAHPHWGSLQELRSFVANCFEHSPGTLNANSDTDAVPEVAEDDIGNGVQKLPDLPDVPGWASSFEKLIEDPVGLQTFAEFLKKEFSHENIYFWVACRRYQAIEDRADRQQVAREIFESHLCVGALEPVNVDSHARQATQEGLTLAEKDLFVHASKQIFNLMKFDSYPRFIKSDLYKECLVRHLSGEPPLFDSPDEQLAPTCCSSQAPKKEFLSPAPVHNKLKKSRSDAEDRRRKSLLPWHRKNHRSKSKDRGETEYNANVTASAASTAASTTGGAQLSSSRSSLASWDLALRGSFSRHSATSSTAGDSVTSMGDQGSSDAATQMLCRVILPDCATTVVQIRLEENIRDMVIRLLDKRGLNYSAFQVFIASASKALSLDDEASSLGGKEVRVEQRVVFRLDLPNRKTIGVKAKPTKLLYEVLRPILFKYGYRLGNVTLCLMSENEVLDLSLPVNTIDTKRIQVLTRNNGENTCWKQPTMEGMKLVKASAALAASAATPQPTLDEITNRVFEELLQGKAESKIVYDQRSAKSEDWGSEHSSGIFGRFLRRDSTMFDKLRESRFKEKKHGGSQPLLEGSDSKIGNVAGCPQTKAAHLLMGKWATKAKGRSESDELYEGLKRAQRCRLEDQRGTEINFELPDFLKDKENSPEQLSKKLGKLRSTFYSSEPAALVNVGVDGSSAPGSDDSTSSASILDQSFSSTGTSVGGESGHPPTPHYRSTSAGTPPPLPPKPKHLPPVPLKHPWRSKAGYLDAPSSSFV